MTNINNIFKEKLRENQVQLGMWAGFASANVTEAISTVGYDWILIDEEHAPNDLRSILSQLQAIAPYPSHPIVRPCEGITSKIKQLLDLGAQTLLVPMVESKEQAEELVRATRYPPTGIRGVGSAVARSSRWGQIEGYLKAADENVCLLVQVESVNALSHLQEIASVEGVDGVFFGPADLSASMGLLGETGHLDVQKVIIDGIAKVRKLGKGAGVLTTNRTLAKKYIDAGATFVAVGVDTTLLIQSAKELLAHFHLEEDKEK